MSFKLGGDELSASTLIEGLSTMIGSAGLPAYMGWHGDSVPAFLAYAVAAGLALTIGIILVHPPLRPGEPEGFLMSWGIQTAIVGIFGGLSFALGMAIH